MKNSLLAIAFLLPSLAWSAEVATREVAYEAGAVQAKGYLAYPDDGKPHPGVLVVHEWWGHNEYARKRARMLAALGYTALAVDMYGDGKTADHPKDAGTYAGMVRKDQREMEARFRGALAFLHAQPEARKDHTAAIGYCFGGNVVLQMARNGVDGLDAVASFHGALGIEEPAAPAKVKAKLLVCNGAADVFITPAQIAEFKKEMTAAGADMKFIDYPGARHGFTNRGADAFGKKFEIPLAYDAEADAASWQELKAFLHSVFGPAGGKKTTP